MDEQPLVSIIMPSFNAERYIAHSIESVLAQTYRHWELLVTDDCSTDSTPQIVRAFAEKDERINFAIAPKHQGIALTRNLSIHRAKGRFVAFLDNDDLWLPNKLEIQIGFMLSNNYAFSYSAYELMNEDGTPKHKVIKTKGEVDYYKYLRNTILGSGTIVMDVQQTGTLVMPLNATSDDMALWCEVLKDGFVAYPINDVLMRYRIRNNSASANKIKASCDVWRVYRQQEKLSLWFSLWCFVGYAFNAVKKRLF